MPYPSPRRQQRGAAMTEFAILMLAMVPLLLYAVFLSDISYHQLELQETVVSSTWDFATRNREPSGDSDVRNDEADRVTKLNRLEYNDHTSSFDDGAEGNNNNDLSILEGHDDNHHNQLAARACWFGNNSDGSDYGTDQASQVTCKIVNADDLGWFTAGVGALDMFHPAVMFGKSKLTKGGLVTCTAKEWVYNYLVPEKYLQGMARKDLSEKKLRTGKVADVGGEGGTTNNILIRDKAAISFDTWAIVNGAKDLKIQNADINTDTSSDNPFYKRAHYFYGSVSNVTELHANQLTYDAAVIQNSAFALKALSEKVMIVNFIPTDDPTPLLAELPASINNFYMTARYKKPSSGRSDPGYHQQCPAVTIYDIGCHINGPEYDSSPWTNYSSSETKTKKAFDKRTLHYMGCTDPYKC